LWLGEAGPHHRAIAIRLEETSVHTIPCRAGGKGRDRGIKSFYQVVVKEEDEEEEGSCEDG